MADNIPIEIQAEILKKLPIKPLIRFRLVSKTWLSLICSSKFIADHSVIHHAQSQSYLLVMTAKENNVIYSHYNSTADDDAFPQFKFFFNLPFSIYLINWDPVILGSSQGLLCFISNKGRGFDYKKVVLWNPTIDKMLFIDVPRVLTNETHQTIVGFGVCPGTSDPKLVKITYNCGRKLMEFDTKGNIAQQVEVFTLSSGVWRSPCNNLPRTAIAFEQNQVVIDEFIYWLAYDRNVKPRIPLIMQFNMTSEEFKEVHLPDSLASGKSQLSIFKRMESLVVVEYNKSPVVWIMQNGNPNLFTKIFTIKTPNAADVLGFRKNGEAIIVTKDNRMRVIFAYHPTSHQMNQVRSGTATCPFVVSTYIETLILLDYKYSSLMSKFEKYVYKTPRLELQARYGVEQHVHFL